MMFLLRDEEQYQPLASSATYGRTSSVFCAKSRYVTLAEIQVVNLCLKKRKHSQVVTLSYLSTCECFENRVAVAEAEGRPGREKFLRRPGGWGMTSPIRPPSSANL